MEISPLAKKLQIKPASRVLLVNSPEDYPARLDPLPRETKVEQKPEGVYDVIQLFSKNNEELTKDLSWLTAHLAPDTVFWIAYPKKNSGIPTDLGMMESWESTARLGLDPVASAAIDSTWTALRFRPKNLVRKSEVRNSEIQKNAYGEYIDVEKRAVVLPETVERLLQQHPVALAFYEGLSYSNKKEYVIWVLSAKQEATRNQRVQKMLEMLKNGKKNPAAK